MSRTPARVARMVRYILRSSDSNWPEFFRASRCHCVGGDWGSAIPEEHGAVAGGVPSRWGSMKVYRRVCRDMNVQRVRVISPYIKVPLLLPSPTQARGRFLEVPLLYGVGCGLPVGSRMATQGYAGAFAPWATPSAVDASCGVCMGF